MSDDTPTPEQREMLDLIRIAEETTQLIDSLIAAMERRGFDPKDAKRWVEGVYVVGWRDSMLAHGVAEGVWPDGTPMNPRDPRHPRQSR